MTPMQAVEIAGKWLEGRGLVLDGLSSQSCSRYYRLPSRIGSLRISDHAACSCVSTVAVDLVFAYRNSVERDERDIGKDVAWVEEDAAEALAEYLAADEPEEDDL